MRGFWQVRVAAGRMIPLALLVCMVAAPGTVAQEPAAKAGAEGADGPLILTTQPGIVSTAFIYATDTFPQCHASTIELAADRLVAAWFGGTREKHPDVGIWLSRQEGDSWSAQAEGEERASG